MYQPTPRRAVGLVVVIVLGSHLAVAAGGPGAAHPPTSGTPGPTVGAADRPTQLVGDDASGTSFTGTHVATLVELVTASERWIAGTVDGPPRLVPPAALFVGGAFREGESPSFENEVRAEIFRAVAESPARHVAELEGLTGIPASTVRYHLRELEDEDLVRSVMIRGKRRFQPPEMDRLVVELEAALHDESTAPVLRAVARLEPVGVSELSGELHLSPSTVSYHVHGLADRDLLERERRGQSVAVRLDPSVRAHLDSERRG